MMFCVKQPHGARLLLFCIAGLSAAAFGFLQTILGCWCNAAQQSTVVGVEAASAMKTAAWIEALGALQRGSDMTRPFVAT
jgi:hypothetical protein